MNYGLEVVNRYETNILNTSYQVTLLRHLAGYHHSGAQLSCICASI